MVFDGNLEREVPEVVMAGGVALRRGSRVRLRPHAGGDALDLALGGRIGVVAGIEQDYDERVHLAVTLEDDPGRDLGDARMPAHRFFFTPDEVEPLLDAPVPRILVAGIGNVFLADDGFGVEVARRLLARPRRPGVAVVDYGIRGLDLAYALQDGWDAVVLVDAARRGQPPGTLSVIEPSLEAGGEPAPEAHAMDPATVLRLARALGPLPPRILLVACEPATLVAPDSEDVLVELSEPVRAAVESAVSLVETVVESLGQRADRGGDAAISADAS